MYYHFFKDKKTGVLWFICGKAISWFKYRAAAWPGRMTTATRSPIKLATYNEAIVARQANQPKTKLAGRGKSTTSKPSIN